MLLIIVAEADGGGRTLALMPAPIRIWEGVRLKHMLAWEEQWLTRPYDWAAAGGGAERAVWRAQLDEEAWSGETMTASGTALLDLEKAYETISHTML